MKLSIAIPLAAMALICRAQAPIQPTPQPFRVTRATISELETAFEERVKSLDRNDTFVLLGTATGVYLNGIGMVFTTPIDLIATPQYSPFHQVISKDEAALAHKRKLAHLPILLQAMKQTVTDAAAKLPGLPSGERIVIAVRLYFFDWEDRSGLPGQVVASADRESALAGKVQLDQQ